MLIFLNGVLCLKIVVNPSLRDRKTQDKMSDLKPLNFKIWVPGYFKIWKKNLKCQDRVRLISKPRFWFVQQYSNRFNRFFFTV